jgi:hypothetical protein
MIVGLGPSILVSSVTFDIEDFDIDSECQLAFKFDIIDVLHLRYCIMSRLGYWRRYSISKVTLFKFDIEGDRLGTSILKVMNTIVYHIIEAWVSSLRYRIYIDRYCMLILSLYTISKVFFTFRVDIEGYVIKYRGRYRTR